MKLKLILLASVVSALGLYFYLNTSTASGDTVKEWIDKGALIVDVRTPEEFASGHFKGAVNIPLQEIESKIDMFGDREKLIIVYCRTGNRSTTAKSILESHGYKNVLNGGGLKDMPGL